MITGNMRGRTVAKILIAIVLFAIGWTLGQVCEDISPFSLDWSISLSDVLSILVEITLAVVLALLIEKGMQNQRIEKDFFISELNTAQESLSELEKSCARLVSLSLHQTVFLIEKPRKDLTKMWEIMKERSKTFHDRENDDFNNLIKHLKTLNSQLSDSTFFKESDGFKPVSITKGVIHLNNTVTNELDATFGALKDAIFKMKIAINDM